MVISSGIGGTGIEETVCSEDMDNFQGEFNFWDEIFTNFRTIVSVPSHENLNIP